jgi:CRP-like cAMP-binding protein
MEKSENGTACEYQENLNILRQIDLFSSLPLEVTKVVAYLCIRETFRTGDFLFQQNDDDGRAFYILSGTGRLVYERMGTEQFVRDFQPGAFVGRLALVGRARRLFSLKALEDVVCLTITREKFSKALEQFPDLMPKIMKIIVENVYNWEKRFIEGRTAECADCLCEIGVTLV